MCGLGGVGYADPGTPFGHSLVEAFHVSSSSPRHRVGQLVDTGERVGEVRASGESEIEREHEIIFDIRHAVLTAGISALRVFPKAPDG